MKPVIARALALTGLGALVAWSLLFIWRTSFVIEGVRFFCLFDDAMISMVYARNLSEGFGLTWARTGEAVEGFTHPLWTFGMILAQIPRLPLAQRPLLVQFASLAFLVANVVVVHRLAARHFCPERPALAWLASVPTAACFPLDYWALVGMETGLQALLVGLCVWLALDISRGGERRFACLGILFALALLLRLDMAVPLACVTLYLLPRARPRREERARIAAACAIVAFSVLGYAAFRVAYYGDWLPNTYYLKLTGGSPEVRALRGALVLWDCVAAAPLTYLGLPLLGLATLRSRPQHALPLAIVATCQLYAIYVGGDVWETSRMTANRFTAFAMPMAFLLLPGAVATLLSRRRVPAGFDLRVALACCVAALVLVIDVNGLWWNERPRRWQYVTLARPIYHYDINQRVVADAVRLSRQLPADSRVAVIWAGIPAYFTDWRLSDCMGYNDRRIARQPWRRDLSLERAAAFFPGHMKFDFARCVVEADAQVIFQWHPAWGGAEKRTARRLGFVRHETGEQLLFSAGEIWVRRPLRLDVAPLVQPLSAPSG